MRFSRLSVASAIVAAMCCSLCETSLTSLYAAEGNLVLSGEELRLPPGFKAELVYEVPMDTQGSWVAMAVDRDGSLLASDQYGGLFRCRFSQPTEDGAQTTVEVVPIAAPIGMIQGIYAGDNGLYVNVNSNKGEENGVYLLTDNDGDGNYETKKHIIPINGTSEHGPHAIIPGPDGRLYAACGNNCEYPQDARWRVPQPPIVNSDFLLGRLPDGRGFMANNMRPGGYVMSFKADGSDVEVMAIGFRNHYDIAFDQRGELFTYDADMEWDIGTPWYRPTRVNHVISGIDYGWRNGTGKYPPYAADSFGAAVDVGYGSPTGIVFGYDAHFPEEYRSSLLIGDWSYGKIYAVHLQPDGATYSGELETFVSGAPFPVTDMVVRPQDGCLYVAIGGRKTQSALYRIKYDAVSAPAAELKSEAPAAAEPADSYAADRATHLREQLATFHQPNAGQAAVDMAIANLGSTDRAIRVSARTVLEHQDPSQWAKAVLEVKDTFAVIQAAVAAARCGLENDYASHIAKLTALPFDSLSETEKLEALRAADLQIIRFGDPSDESRERLLSWIGEQFNVGHGTLVDREVAALLVRLNADGIIPQVVAQLNSRDSSDENQIQYAFILRDAGKGWTDDSRRQYFEWFHRIGSARGGASFGGFLESIRAAAVASLSEDERQQMAAIIDKPFAAAPLETPTVQREFVEKYTVDSLLTRLSELDGGDAARGKEIFAAAQCFKCHRYAGQGGIQGPDLSGAGGRFSPRDLLVAIVEPSHEISDQYQATQFLTEDDEVVVGRIANLRDNVLQVATNMLDPGNFTNIKREDIAAMRPSPVSMMPEGLLDTFTVEEINDLITYIRSGAMQVSSR